MGTEAFSAGILFRRLLEAGWTRRRISNELGIADAQVSRILNGYNPDVRIGTALAWANALHITLNDLYLLGTGEARGAGAPAVVRAVRSPGLEMWRARLGIDLASAA